MDRKNSYRDAGVDLERAVSAKAKIRDMARSTFTPGVLQEVGGFGGLFSLQGIEARDPVLVSSTDGVGTKLKIAFATGIHDTVGRDLVAHCVNDILTLGARPLFFLDYIATGALDVSVVTQVVSGLAEECRSARCALIGGETAQLPDFYAPGEYDLAGFIVGWVQRDRILGPERVGEGDVLVGLGSSGLHTNGYSLARRILLEQAGLSLNDPFPESECTVGEELLKVHRCYLPLVDRLLHDDGLHAMAHITGGGITENLPRILPPGLSAQVYRDRWTVPPVFGVLQRLGHVDDAEMIRVFNMGIGLILVVARDRAAPVRNHLHDLGERTFELGELLTGSREVHYM